MKVRVVEKSVKSHVGKVYDTQKRMLGSTLSIERMTRPSKPNVDLEATSVASGEALAVCKVRSAAAAASTRDVVTVEAMVTTVEGCKRYKMQQITEYSPPLIYRSGAGKRCP